MKTEAIIILNKKGQCLFLVTSNSFPSQLGFRYSFKIYEHILDVSRKGRKVDRSIDLDVAMKCICSIIGDMIILVIVGTSSVSTGTQASKKLSQFFKNNQKLEHFNKKYLEIEAMLEDCLYTRELNTMKQFFFKTSDMKGSGIIGKPVADCEVFGQFVEMECNKERNSIANIPLKYWVKYSQQHSTKTVEKCMHSIEFQSPDGGCRPKTSEKYKKFIAEQRALRYRCAFKLGLKQASQNVVLANQNYTLKRQQVMYQNNTNQLQQQQQQVSSQQQQQQYINNNNPKPNQFQSISSADVRTIKQQQQQYQGQQSQQQYQFQSTPVSLYASQQPTDLLDLDVTEAPAKVIKRQPIFGDINSTAVMKATRNTTAKSIPNNQSNVKQINLLDSDDETEPSSYATAPSMTGSNTSKQQIFQTMPLPQSEQQKQQQIIQQQQQQQQQQSQQTQQKQLSQQQQTPQQYFQSNLFPSRSLNPQQYQIPQKPQQQQSPQINPINQSVTLNPTPAQFNSTPCAPTQQIRQPQQQSLQNQLNAANLSNPVKQLQSQLNAPIQPILPSYKVGLKILERLSILQKDNSFPEGLQLNGQIMIEGQFQDEIVLIELKGKNWNPNAIKHRAIPNSLPSRANSTNTAYQVKVDKASFVVPKAIIEMILNSPVFLTTQQVPLFFFYTLEEQASNSSMNFKFQYMLIFQDDIFFTSLFETPKVNQKWTCPLLEVEFSIVLDDRLIFSDMHSLPIASSYQNKILLWKTQLLNPNERGTLSLTLTGANLPSQEVLKYIKLQMKADNAIQDLEATLSIQQPQKAQIQSQNRMLIEYKIMPNSSK